MNDVRHFLNAASRPSGDRQSLLAVGLALVLMLLAPAAIQQLGLLRAAENETNENRSELEGNERIHLSVQANRKLAKNRGVRTAACQPQRDPSDQLAIARAADDYRQLVPAVVAWSPSRRL